MSKDLHMLTEKAAVVVVPENAIRFNIRDGVLRWTLSVADKTKQVENGNDVILPVGDFEWTILALGKDLTEKQWKEVVEYGDEYDGEGYSEKETGLFLLRQKGLSPDTSLVIIKNDK